jgi:DNA-binding transcriptional LysR family regulator
MYSNRIDVFVTVSQYLNFSEAANHLHIAQSAVSRSIAELEKEIGARLFDRTKRGCILTPAGEVFLEEAFKMITLANCAKSKVEKIATGKSGELVAGYPSELMIDPLVPCLKEFILKYPNVDLHFTNFNSLSVARMLHTGEVDVAFGREESFFKRENVEWRMVFRNPLHVVMAPEHRLAKERKINIEMLEHETIILLSRANNPGFFDVVQKMFLMKDMTPLLDTTVNDRMSAILLVRLGKGMTVLSKQYMSIHAFPDIVTVPIDDEYANMDLGIAWHKNVANPVVHLLLKEIDAYLAPLQGGVIRI